MPGSAQGLKGLAASAKAMCAALYERATQHLSICLGAASPAGRHSMRTGRKNLQRYFISKIGKRGTPTEMMGISYFT